MERIRLTLVALMLAGLVLAGCTATAKALSDRLANAPAPQRVALLRSECAATAARNKFGAATLTASCAAMESQLMRRTVSATGRASFDSAYRDCANESTRDNPMIVSLWHRGGIQFYRQARAICDAYRALFDLRHPVPAAQAP